MYRLLLTILIAAATLTSTPGVAADELTAQLPGRTLGFVAIRNLSQADQDARQVLDALGVALPGPLEVVRTLTGAEAGLNESGELAIMLLEADPPNASPELAVLVPVVDYEQFITALGGDPSQQVSGVEIAEQQLLATRRGSWALLTDADADIHHDHSPNDTATQSAAAGWQALLAESDVAVVLLPAGLAKLQTTVDDVVDELTDDDPFAPLEAVTGDGWDAWWRPFARFLREHPEGARLMRDVEGVAVGVAIEDDVRVAADLHVRWNDEASIELDAPTRPPAKQEPLARLASGEFIALANGMLPAALLDALIPWSVRHELASLDDRYENNFPAAGVAALEEALRRAVARTEQFTLVARPAAATEGVYSNAFLLMETNDAAALEKDLADAMRAWNALMDHAKGEICLFFASQPVEIAGRRGTEYAADMAAAVGAKDVPNIDKEMSRIYGEGGLYRFQLLRVDDATVLLAEASQAQTARLLADWQSTELPLAASGALNGATDLVDPSAEVVTFISPRGYTQRLRHEAEALMGDAIGGPNVTLFPPCPPVAMTFGSQPRELSLRVTAPSETLRAAGQYLQAR